jgi:hypothetical protein
VAALAVEKVGEGLWRWTVAHPEWDGATDWDEVVGSVYCETPEATVVIDPLVPAGADAGRFWHAFDRDVERRGVPVVVLLTCRWHMRSAQAFRERHRARVYAPTTTGHGVHEGVTDLVIDGAEVIPGVLALVTGSPAPNEECVYVLTDHRAAVVGDILLGDANGGLRVADAGWYATNAAERAWYRNDLAASLGRLLVHDLGHLFVAHGAPIAPEPMHALKSVLARHQTPQATDTERQ